MKTFTQLTEEILTEEAIHFEYLSLQEGFSNEVNSPPILRWLDKLLRDKFAYNETMEPGIWDNTKPGAIGTLNPKIRAFFINSAKEFIDGQIAAHVLPADIKSKIFSGKTPGYDIELKGSCCNFNYTKESDIDIHIVIPGHEDEPREMTRARIAFKTANAGKLRIKTKFNPRGYPLEFFFRGPQQKAAFDAIYSLKFNTWKKKPTYKPPVDKKTVVKTFGSLYNELYKEYEKGLKHDYKSLSTAPTHGTFPKGKTAGVLYAKDYISALMEKRKSILNFPPYNEFDEWNLAFKALRRTKLWAYIDTNKKNAIKEFNGRNNPHSQRK